MNRTGSKKHTSFLQLTLRIDKYDASCGCNATNNWVIIVRTLLEDSKKVSGFVVKSTKLHPSSVVGNKRKDLSESRASWGLDNADVLTTTQSQCG